MYSQTQPTNITDRRGRSAQKSSHEWRCSCGRLLFKGAFVAGIIEIKCPRCKRIVYLQEYNTFPSGRESFMAVIDLDGRISTLNGEVNSVLGYQEPDLIGKNLADLIQPEARTSLSFWLDKIQEVSSTENPNVVGTTKLKNQQGDFVQVALVAKHIILEGRPMIFLIIENDETALQRYSEQFVNYSTKNPRNQREIWDFVVQKDGTVIESSGTSSLGYAKNDLINKSILTIFTNSQLNNIAKLKQDLAAGQSFNLTAELTQFDGSAKTQDIAFTLDVLVEDQKDRYLMSFKNPK